MMVSRKSRLGSVLGMGATLAAAIMVASFSLADEPKPTTKPAGDKAERHENHEALEHGMETMNRAQKKIEKQLADPAQDASTLKLIGDMQKATIDAKNALPGEVFDTKGDERAKEVAAYRVLMIDLLKAEITLEEAVVKGDRDAAKAAIEHINDLRKNGHTEYGVRDRNGNLK